MSVKAFLLDHFCPTKSVFCRALLPQDKWEDGVCGKCAEKLPFTVSPRGAKRGEFFDFCVAPLYYRDEVRDAIHRYKFSGNSSYGAVFGRLVAEAVKNEPDAVFDTVTWAPVSAGRLRKRGYDQAMLIAQSAAGLLGKPCEPLLKKIRNAPPQSRLQGSEKRRANISGAYICRPDAETAGKSILLIDDVITSGSTLSECSRMLLMGGAERVICAVLARTE